MCGGIKKSITGDVSSSGSITTGAKPTAASISNRRMTSNTPEPGLPGPSDFEPARSKIDGDGCIARSNWSHSSSDSDSPNFLKWSENLDVLLNDPVGLDLFQEYLKQEDQDRYHMLKFWLACRGLPKQPKDRLTDCIKVIYSQLFLKIGQGINGDLGKSLAHQIFMASKNKTPLSASVFDEASEVVYDVMKTVMYPNFLSSETYLNYAQKMQVESCDLDNNSGEAPAFTDDELPKNYSQSLAVVEEDKELNFDALSIGKSESLRQLIQPRPTCSSRMCRSTNVPLHYNSYNPVSRQGSEKHSLSSGRTDSQTDLTHFAEDLNAVSDTGKSYVEQRRQQHRQRQRSKHAEEQPEKKHYVNPAVHLPVMRPFKPRTFNEDVPDKMKAVNPNELASKLEMIKKEQEIGGLVRRKIHSIDCDEFGHGSMAQHSLSDTTLNRIDDDDQDILDEHVKRIWSDKTPGKSPCFGTPPLPKSPTTRRASSVYSCPNEKTHCPSTYSSRSSHPYLGYSSIGRRKDREIHSSFSIDSGNGTDRAEFGDLNRRNSYRHKSSSEHSIHSTSSSAFVQPGLHPAYASNSWAGSRKTITDSGVSVISKSMADSIAAASITSRDRLLSSWQQEKKFSQPGKSSRSLIDDIDPATMMNKRKTKSIIGQSKPKGGVVPKNPSLPGQPFLADPNMPPLPFYKMNALDTLDETKRRLQDLPSVQQQPSNESSTPTSVVYNFSDEAVPYLLKIPGNRITLKMFKDHMPPKKGNFRYFFVTMCEEFENKPVYEEINDDNRVLPLWKGKIMSQIKDSK